MRKITFLLLAFIILDAYGQDHPEAINCLFDKYLSEMTSTKKISDNVKENPLWSKLTSDRYTKADVIDSGQVISIDWFYLERNKDKGKADGFALEIWKLTSSDNATALFNALYSLANSSAMYEKPPQVFIVYRNYIVRLWVSAVAHRKIIWKEQARIQECFEANQIRTFGTHSYKGD
jgi:hypothetical protein